MESLSLRLESASIDSVLKRGFAWVKDDNNQTIYSVKNAEKAQKLVIRFADGELQTSTENTKTKKTKKDTPPQGSLFDF